jgi:cell division transport system permease protein
MQMVGATRGFISRPMNVRATINGGIAAVIAIVIVMSIILLFEWLVPDFKLLRDNNKLALLFAVLLAVGIGITLLSTHRSVTKYLRMKLDELY